MVVLSASLPSLCMREHMHRYDHTHSLSAALKEEEIAWVCRFLEQSEIGVRS